MSFLNRLLDSISPSKDIDFESNLNALKGPKFKLFNKDFFKIYLFDINKLFLFLVAFFVSGMNIVEMSKTFDTYYSWVTIALVVAMMSMAYVNKYSKISSFNGFVLRTYVVNLPMGYREMRLVDIVLVGSFAMGAIKVHDYNSIELLLVGYLSFRICYYYLFYVFHDFMTAYLEANLKFQNVQNQNEE